MEGLLEKMLNTRNGGNQEQSAESTEGKVEQQEGVQAQENIEGQEQVNNDVQQEIDQSIQGAGEKEEEKPGSQEEQTAIEEGSQENQQEGREESQKGDSVLNWSSVKETLGLEFESVEDLKSALNKKPEIEFESDEAKSLYQAIAKGDKEKALKYLEYQLTDYSEMGDDEVVIRYLKDSKGWSDDRINRYLNTKYFLGQGDEDEDLLTDEQKRSIEIAKVEFEDLADAARNHFNSKKSDINLPVYEEPTKQEQPQLKEEDIINKYLEQAEAQGLELDQQWFNMVESSVPKMNRSLKLDVPLGDGDDKGVFTVNYQLTDNDVSQLQEHMKGYILSDYDMKFVQGEGQNAKVDIAALGEDLSFRLFGKKILKAAMKEYAAKEKEKFIEKDLKNVSYAPRQTEPTKGENITREQQLFREILGR